jgi:NAD(P)-dependent dehydrogenase (short-subunit alcohol dehydrogenase family)
VDVKGLVAVVTGAARGLGRAIAEGFAAAGAKVALVDVLAEALDETSADLAREGGEVLPVVADITDPAQVQAMAESIRTSLGPAQILINNAGSLSALGPVWQADAAKWARDVTVNLIGTFLVTRALVPQMIESGGGYVISLFGAGVDPPHLYTTAYDSSKAGVVRLAEALAKEAEPHNIKSFALRPGTVRTAMTDFIRRSPEGRKWRPSFERIFTEGRDVPPRLAVDWCLRLVGGAADQLTGRWLDATEDFDETVRAAREILREDRRLLRGR